MRIIRQDARRAASQAGQSIYQTMLIISCVALALAVFFPVYEIFDLYRGPIKDVEGSASTAYRRSTPARTTKPEPAADTDAESASDADTSESAGDTEAPDSSAEPTDDSFTE